MRHIREKILFIALLCFTLANAQSNDTLEIQKNGKGKVKFARFQANANSNRKMQNDTVFLRSILQAKKEDSFRKIKEDLDELGITHEGLGFFSTTMPMVNCTSRSFTLLRLERMP